jgi:hypothetical protein
MLEDEGATHFAPEYERYGDHNEDPQSQSSYSQQQKRPQQRIKYRHKTFDDEVESDGSFED